MSGARYFAYGSNLDAADRADWSARTGHPLALGAGVPAFLPDFELVFYYHSRSRGGGALDVRTQVGAAVMGALFTPSDEEWAALDRKEGATVRYARTPVICLDHAGEEHRAITYCVEPAYREPEHVLPTADYVEICTRGLRAHGHEPSALERAARGSNPAWPGALFVYGTLLGDASHSGMLDVDERIAARVEGRLVDLGEYPGWIVSELDRASDVAAVRGELVTLRDPETTMLRLDEYEGFAGYGAPGSLYRRVLTRVRTDDGERWAWAYRYVGSRPGRPIDGGDWRRR
ncbi:MAG: gamma-glutamylcyclotransferase [Sandaracinaceae bacterium]